MDEILKKFKEKFKYAKLPSKIKFKSENAKTVKMVLAKEAIYKNMQNDDAAFEGWALILKCVAKYDEVVFEWENTTNTNDGHYQRFLFRMQNFINDFGEWASCDDPTLLSDLKIVNGKKYSINQPSKRDKINKSNAPIDESSESDLENYFINNKNLLIDITNANEIDRQLPVGVFVDKTIDAKSRVFTGGKSATDLWGINAEKKELLIFELKAKGNKKVGIISELYFYVCVMRNVIDKGNIKYGEPNKHNKEAITLIENAKRIKAFFLTECLHPLITREVVDKMNKKVPSTSFGYLQIGTNNNEISVASKEEW